MKSLEDDKAENIVLLDVTGRADRLIIATGQVERQLQSMATHLDEAQGKAGLRLRRNSIQASGDWVLIDASDLVIHLFRPERESSAWNGCGGPRAPAWRRSPTPRAARILAVGRIEPGPEAALLAYAAGLRPPPEVVEISEARGSPAEVRRREGAHCWPRCPPMPGRWRSTSAANPPTASVSPPCWPTRTEPAAPCFLIGGAGARPGCAGARRRADRARPHDLAAFPGARDAGGAGYYRAPGDRPGPPLPPRLAALTRCWTPRRAAARLLP